MIIKKSYLRVLKFVLKHLFVYLFRLQIKYVD